MILDGLWDLVQQRPHGHLRRGVRRRLQTSAAPRRTSSRSSRTKRAIQAQKEGLFKAEIVPVRVPAEEGRPRRGHRGRGPQERQAGQDRRPQAGLQEGRHGHRRQRLVDQRRRRGAGADERRAREGRGPHRARARSRGYAAAARKPVEFTIAPADAINKLLEKTEHQDRATSTSGRSTRPSRWWRIANNQLLKLDPPQGQRARRRGGARPPDRRLGRAAAGDAAARR